MPSLSIQTNITVESSKRAALLKRFSAAYARLLSKPENYVCVCLQDGLSMTFGGSEEPAALVQVVSLGLQGVQIPPLAKELNALVCGELGLEGGRVYIHFEAPERTHFAMDGKPFATAT